MSQGDDSEHLWIFLLCSGEKLWIRKLIRSLLFTILFGIYFCLSVNVPCYFFFTVHPTRIHLPNKIFGKFGFSHLRKWFKLQKINFPYRHIDSCTALCVCVLLLLLLFWKIKRWQLHQRYHLKKKKRKERRSKKNLGTFS